MKRELILLVDEQVVKKLFILIYSNMLRKQELPGIYVIPSAQKALCKYHTTL